MKFSAFFGKYTICTLIYSLISMLVGIAGFGALYLIGKKAQEKEDNADPIEASDFTTTDEEN